MMKNRADIKELLSKHSPRIEKWAEYLRTVEQEHNVTCVLAGGCLRDVLLGANVKDLDVFVIPNAPMQEDDVTGVFDKITEDNTYLKSCIDVTVRWNRIYSGSSCQ